MSGEEDYSSDGWHVVKDDEGKFSSDESFVTSGFSSSSSDTDDDHKDNEPGSGADSEPMDNEKEVKPDPEPMDSEEEADSNLEQMNGEESYSSDEGRSLLGESIDLSIENSPARPTKLKRKIADIHMMSEVPPLRKLKPEIKDVAHDFILPLLPAKSLARFSSVSKEWHNRVKSPFLAHEQSYHFKALSGFICQYSNYSPSFISLNKHAYGIPSPGLNFLPSFSNIISSSNGLLLCKGEDDLYYMCNPATQAWKVLPEPAYYHGSDPATIIAFEPSLLNMGADYQLISAVPMFYQPFVCFEIYSSETNSWRVSDEIVPNEYSFVNHGLYINGMAYWETSTRHVLAFDVKNEIHGLIPLPDAAPNRGVLARVRDELCYIVLCDPQDHYSPYSLRIYSGVDFREKHDVYVNLYPNRGTGDIVPFRVLACADGEVVMIRIGNVVHACSLVSQEVETIRINGAYDAGSMDMKYLPYVNSLVNVA